MNATRTFTGHYIGKCDGNGRHIYFVDGGAFPGNRACPVEGCEHRWLVNDPFAAGYIARTRPAWVKFKAITGTVTDKKCGGACTRAKSDRCDCACGGDNHGAGLPHTLLL